MLIVGNIEAPALEGSAFANFSWLLLLVLGAILAYYVVATLLPVDKIIGRLYPVFGVLLFFMAAGMLCVLLLSGDYPIPELTSWHNCIHDPQRFPIVPMLFPTIACGALSGFHATQSPLLARCLQSEGQARAVFYGAMIAESILALIWATVAMAFWGGTGGLNAASADSGGQAAVLVERMADSMLGLVIAPVVVFGVVVCGITSGDTAFRSSRLIVSDMLGIGQRSLRQRMLVCLPLFASGLAVIFFLPFGTIWSYFAWMNQMLATVTLWMITAWLYRGCKNYWVGLVPALIMTYICACYIFLSPLMCGLGACAWAYAWGGIVTSIMAMMMILKLRRDAESRP